MKWREPWRNTLRRQEFFDLFSRNQLLSGLIWTAALFVIFLLRAWGSEKPIDGLFQRAWMVPMFGFGLSLLINIGHWLSPISVSSGPRGIVRSKGRANALIPWAAIKNHRFYAQGDESVLELAVDYKSEPERLYLPLKLETAPIGEELERMSLCSAA